MGPITFTMLARLPIVTFSPHRWKRFNTQETQRASRKVYFSSRGVGIPRRLSERGYKLAHSSHEISIGFLVRISGSDPDNIGSLPLMGSVSSIAAAVALI